jgi:hypothetical protein
LLSVAAKVGTVERVIARLASGAHGVVTRVELGDAGLTKAEIDGRVRSGALIVEFRGVYRAGHRGAERRGALPGGGQGLR